MPSLPAYNLVMVKPALSQHSAMDSCVVRLPAEVLRLLGPTRNEAAACLARLGLIELFRRGEMSSGYAAELLGLCKWEFIELLAQHRVPYIDLSEEELRRDLEVARAFHHRQDNSSSPIVES
jgi:predicted HTH domain antitoxin